MKCRNQSFTRPGLEIVWKSNCFRIIKNDYPLFLSFWIRHNIDAMQHAACLVFSLGLASQSSHTKVPLASTLKITTRENKNTCIFGFEHNN